MKELLDALSLEFHSDNTLRFSYSGEETATRISVCPYYPQQKLGKDLREATAAYRTTFNAVIDKWPVSDEDNEQETATRQEAKGVIVDNIVELYRLTLQAILLPYKIK